MKAKAIRAKAKAGKKNNLRIIITLGILLTLLFGWVSWNISRSQTLSTPEPTGRIGANVDDTAPDFSVTTLEGETFILSEQRDKPTVVFFMAYWCGTCIPEAQALARIQNEFNVHIAAIDVDPSSTPEKLAQFKNAAQNGGFVWAFDTDQLASRYFEVRALDTTLIMDSNGVIVYRDEVPTSYGTLKDVLEQLEAGNG